MPTWSER